MKHIIQALVENKFGVLARVASLFSARGYNIESLAVGETHDSTISCMTMVVDAADERILEQIKKQLNKLIDVIAVNDFTYREYVDRELVMVKINKKSLDKKVWEKICKEYPVKIIGDTDNNLILEICANHKQSEEIIQELKNFNIVELVRTGRIAVGK